MKKVTYRNCPGCGRRFRTTSTKAHYTCRKCRGFKRRIVGTINAIEKFPYTLVPAHISVILAVDTETKTIEQIATIAEIPKSTVYRLISQLMLGGFIGKIGSLYQLTERSINLVLKLKGWGLDYPFLIRSADTRKVRFHALQVRFNVETPPANFEKYRNAYFCIPIGRTKSKTGFKLHLMDALIIFYSPRSISATIPDVFMPYSADPTDRDLIISSSFSKVGIYLLRLKDRLEELFKGLVINPVQPFQIDKAHIALMDSKFAKLYYDSYGGYYRSSLTKVDHSHGIFEHEGEAIEKIEEGMKWVFDCEDQGEFRGQDKDER